MNIILTSAGLKTQSSVGPKSPAVRDAVLKALPKPPSDYKVAHVPTASRLHAETPWVEWEAAALHECGFEVTNVWLEDLKPETAFDVLNRYDIILVDGGDPFYLLKQARACGFEQAVRKFLQDPDKWYFGNSAGSWIACPTIEVGDWKRKKDDHHGLTDLTAMNLVPFLLVVHYNREKYREVLAEKIPTASRPVRILTDDQAFLVRDGRVELIGEGPEIMASTIVDEDSQYEKDIQTIIRYLKIHDPENADRDYAIQFLDSMEAFGSEIARSDEALAEMIRKATARKKKAS